MKYLLDTHSFLWFITENTSLSSEAKQIMEKDDSVLILSVASSWEISIKYSIGKLPLPTDNLDVFIRRKLAENRIQVLSIKLKHALGVAKLPLIHNDPFDRLIITQSLSENLPIISIDKIFDAYGVERKW